MIDLTFQSLDSAATQKFLDAVKGSFASVSLEGDGVSVQYADLPFYDEVKLYAITDSALPPPNTRYVLYRKGDVCVMDWTNEPIYDVNERAPIKIDRKTCIPYARFFFHFVRGQLGRFIIVEKPEEVSWLPNATEQEKTAVNQKLLPLTYKGIGRDNLITLTATVVFKNALFKTDIKIAPFEMDAFDPELNAPEHFGVGQMKLVNEDLLLEDLNVPIDPPPGEFG
ncbi:MAG: hypothetical protein PHS57_01965 [Alphaproteobacteria bacterium]|nr:hypothetical protein [Alphaproteobacteria bacterium]